MIKRESMGTLSAKEIAEQFRTKIARGEFLPGQRLPTVREMAKEFRVSSDTTYRAYKILGETGLINMRHGANTFVANPLPGKVGASVLQDVIGKGPYNEFEALSESSNVRSFATNVGDPKFFQVDAFLAELRDVFNCGPWGFYYGPPEGDLGLRSSLADWLTKLGTPSTAERLVITMGSQQAFTLLGRLLLSSGDSVAIEGADHLGGQLRWSALGIQRNIIPRLVGELPNFNEIEADKSKVIVVSPTGCGATGRVMSTQSRRQLLKICSRKGTLIIEDTSNAGFCFVDRPQDLASEDNKVIQIGSFANILAPGLRIGYILASLEICAALSRQQQIETGGLGLPMQIALANYMRGGALRDQIRRSLPKYRKRRDTLLSSLAKFMPKGNTWTIPQAGFACKVMIQGQIDQRDLYNRAVESGVAFMPGLSMFHESESSHSIRICFGNQSEARIEEGTRILADLMRAN